MSINRRRALQLGGAAALIGLTGGPARAEDTDQEAVGGQILRQWYRVVLRLVRHTATYSPPVASRAFAYLGVAAYQAVASGSTSLVSLAGQLNGLKALPPRDPAKRYSDAVITHCVMASAVKLLRQHRPHRPARDGGGREEAEGRCHNGPAR